MKAYAKLQTGRIKVALKRLQKSNDSFRESAGPWRDERGQVTDATSGYEAGRIKTNHHFRRCSGLN